MHSFFFFYWKEYVYYTILVFILYDVIPSVYCIEKKNREKRNNMEYWFLWQNKYNIIITNIIVHFAICKTFFVHFAKCAAALYNAVTFHQSSCTLCEFYKSHCTLHESTVLLLNNNWKWYNNNITLF